MYASFLIETKLVFLVVENTHDYVQEIGLPYLA